MPLTPFGKACQGHRRGMKAVIAQQAAATGLSPSSISKVERGIQNPSANYLKSLIEWMRLENEDAVELALLATLHKAPNRVRGEDGARAEENLASILDRFADSQTKTETVDDQG